MMKVLRKKRKGGFTLIELIVVIAILGILAAIAIPRFGLVQKRAAWDADEASIATIRNAAQIYATDLNDFSDITVATLQTGTGATVGTITWQSAGMKAVQATYGALAITFSANGEPNVSTLTTALGTRP